MCIRDSTSPAVRGAWKTTSKAGTEAIFLWENGLANGYPAHVTNQISDNKVIFGDFSNVVMGEWDGMEVIIDPFTAKKTGQIEVQVTSMCDIQYRHPEGFSISTDAGNQ